MFRAALVAVSLLSIQVDVFAQAGPQDYTSQLIKLTTLSDNKQYREALDGYRLLELQPGTPGWLKAACEYEIAELHAALQETDTAIQALSGAVRLGFDDCVTPRMSEGLRTVLQNPKATQALASMKITEADFRELVWLKAEMQHVRHDSRMMILENTNRLDHDATVVPQAQMPARPTTSAGVMYWRQQLLLRQRMQREFVMRADVARIQHAATMAVISRIPPSVVFESARRARAIAESRSLEVRRRALDLLPPASTQTKACSEWSSATQPSSSL